MFRLFTISLVSLVLTNSGVSQDQKSPERWEPNIQKFEQKIADGTSKPGSILFIGSSSIVKWDLAKWFPDRALVNHGFGGSEISDSLHYFDRAVTPLKPAMIVMYAGDNDIAKGKTAEIVHRDFNAFAARVKTELAPGTKLAFIAIKPSAKRWNLSPEMAKANALIAKDCAADDQLLFIDVWTPMLTGEGPPPDKWFVKDGLHLSDEGYRLWTDIVRGYLPKAE
ncbi:MAG: GDSL-type esterase/lipase family protein [Planctomycetaceae bacterium]